MINIYIGIANSYGYNNYIYNLKQVMMEENKILIFEKPWNLIVNSGTKTKNVWLIKSLQTLKTKKWSYFKSLEIQ